MISEYLVAGFGILVAATPFLGLPGSWKKALLLLVGASIFYLAFRIKRRGGHSPKPRIPRKKASTFADNHPSGEQVSTLPGSSVVEAKKSVRRIHPLKEIVKEEIPVVASDITPPSA
jgi:hypothetical protein